MISWPVVPQVKVTARCVLNLSSASRNILFFYQTIPKIIIPGSKIQWKFLKELRTSLHNIREVVWFGLVLWHINYCKLFNAKSIYIHINSSILNNSVQQRYTVSQSKTVPFQTIQISISTQFSSIWPIDRTISDATPQGQSGSGIDGMNEYSASPPKAPELLEPHHQIA